MLQTGNYSTILCFCALVICDTQWVTVALPSELWISTKVVTALFSCYMAGAIKNCCCLGTSSVYTTQPCTSLQCHFIWSHICWMHVCLAVTCHLHFWQNDWDLLRAAAVTRGWNGYRNKSQHRKLILEKKILPPLLQGFEPATFRSRVRRSNHWAIPAPTCRLHLCCVLAAAIGR